MSIEVVNSGTIRISGVGRFIEELAKLRIVVVRPGEKREVQETVDTIRAKVEQCKKATDSGMIRPLAEAILAIADHFESEARKTEPPEAKG